MNPESDARTLPLLLARQADRMPGAVALRHKQRGIWRSFTWADCQARTASLALAMQAAGLERGDAVLILGPNRPEWVWCYLAAQACGAAAVAAHPQASPADIAHLLEATGARLVVAQGQEQIDMVLELGAQAAGVQGIVHLDGRGMGDYTDRRLQPYEALLREGNELRRQQPGAYPKLLRATSGTQTAVSWHSPAASQGPKLISLDADALVARCERLALLTGAKARDEYVPVLPLGSGAEQLLAIGVSLWTGMKVSFPESASTAASDLREIGPSVVCRPAQGWEELAAQVDARMEGARNIKRLLFDAGMARGRAAHWAGRGSLLAEALAGRPLRDHLGLSNVRYAACHGDEVPQRMAQFFGAIGVPIQSLDASAEPAHSQSASEDRPPGDRLCDTLAQATPWIV